MYPRTAIIRTPAGPAYHPGQLASYRFILDAYNPFDRYLRNHFFHCLIPGSVENVLDASEPYRVKFRGLH